MKLLPFLLALLLGYAALPGADINATLVDGGAPLYEKLLARVKKAKADDETALQQALLYKLINLSRHAAPPDITITSPRDEEAYRKLVTQFGNWSLTRAAIRKRLASLKEKIQTLGEQIAADAGKGDLTLQLQYAFYQKGLRLYNQKLARLDDAIQKATDALVEGVRRIRFDADAARQRIGTIQKELRAIRRERQKLEVERERLNLLGRTRGVKQINDRLAHLEAERKSLLNDKMVELFLLFSDALHNQELDATFRLQKEILSIVRQNYGPDVYSDVAALMRTMEKRILGSARTLQGMTMAELRDTLNLFWHKANAPLFSINKTPISAFKLLMALLIFVAGLIVGGFYKSSIGRISRHSKTITPATRTLLANLGYYAIIIVAFFIGLNVLGINLSSIALVAGALSVGIGFGLQNIVSNFVSGIILMFERSIKIGDYIEFDENLRGHVSDIRMRSTTITTNDNIDVIVPNQELIQNRVINWTMNDRIRRFRIPFGVAYGTDVHLVVDVILNAIRTSDFTDIYTDVRRQTRVIMTGMGDSSVDFELFVWVRGEEILYPRRTTSRFLMLIYDALYEAGIEIPFPQRDIHIRSVDGEIPLRLQERQDNREESRKPPHGDAQ